LTEEGFDLAEEAVYLHFSEAPHKILDGHGQCLIARPVIGPKKLVAPPLSLNDWKAAPVWQEKLQGETLIDLLNDAVAARQRVIKGQIRLVDSFSLRVQRKLSPDLILSVELIFHE
jgi:hypothetical protein